MNQKLILGLPWQLVEPMLQAAHVPFTIEIGQNYNKFFTIGNEGYYVGRVVVTDGIWHVLLYTPMVNSEFGKSREVAYAKELLEV